MTNNARQGRRDALALDEAERGEIAVAGVEEAWRHEVRRRVAETDAGEVELVPGETVRKDLVSRLNDARVAR
ncbi:MAG: addiction module protein [Thermoanaerobaculia bacterium]|nr:addiction module protein [Thermoanaerobaculia bacterium]